MRAARELGADPLGGRHELARGGQQVAVAVPSEADEPRRQPDVDLDRADAGVVAVDAEPGQERRAHARGDEPVDRLVVVGAEDDAGRAASYRRGSPVYRAERIEAPLLILHGRKDKRVVPLMTERMVEALEIEGKTFEVHWYDDEGHGWERRENRRDAYERTLGFLRTHVLDEVPED